MNRAIKYRIYPTKEQEILFYKTFGCCRKIWNLMLADKIAHYQEHGAYLQTTPAQYKKKYPFLKEVDSLALANVQLNLQKAYKEFFRQNTEFPKFKSAKHSRKTYTTNNQNGTVELTDNSIKLPKTGYVKAKIHRKPDINWKLKSACISQDSDGKFYVSVLFEYKTEKPEVPVTENNTIGLDYKSDGLYTDNLGKTCGMPHYYRKSSKKLAKAQRKLKHKTSDSQNYKKQQKRIAKIHRHISNQRKDFLHKESSAITKQYAYVCVEDLDMKAMSNKSFGNGKATLDNGYGMLLNMLSYKLEAHGGKLVRVNKFYPSSQLCYACGIRHPEMKDLRIRVLHCICGYTEDRDYNAAKNIKREGLKLLSA